MREDTSYRMRGRCSHQWNHFKVYVGARPSQHRFHSLGCPPGPGGWAAGRWCDLCVRTCSSYNWRAAGIRAGTLETPPFPAASRRPSGRAGAAGDWGEDGRWMGEGRKRVTSNKNENSLHRTPICDDWINRKAKMQTHLNRNIVTWSNLLTQINCINISPSLFLIHLLSIPRSFLLPPCLSLT